MTASTEQHSYLFEPVGEDTNTIPVEWLQKWLDNAPALVTTGHPIYTRKTWWDDVCSGVHKLSYTVALKEKLEACDDAFSTEFFWNLDYRFEMRPLNTVVRHAIKLSFEQHGLELDGGENDLHSTIIVMHTHPNYLDLEWIENPVLKAIIKTYESDDLYPIFTKTNLHCGPFDGACYVCATAIQQAFGGELVRLISELNNGQTEHYGVEIDGNIFDMGGMYTSGQDWAKAFSDEQFVNDRTLTFARGVGDDVGEYLASPEASEQICKLLEGASSPTIPKPTHFYTQENAQFH